MKTIILLGLLIFWLAYPTVGQSVRGGAGFVYAGVSHWPGIANAIQQLNIPGSPVGSDNYTLVGGDLYVRMNRWLVGGGVSALANQHLNGLVAGSSSESSASNAHLWVGWLAWNGNRLSLYPGIGPGTHFFHVNAIAPGGQTITYNIGGFSADAALTLNWLLSGRGPDAGLRAGPMLSIRAGYRLNLASGAWQREQTNASGQPVRYSPYGFYLTVGIGGGGFRTRE